MEGMMAYITALAFGRFLLHFLFVCLFLLCNIHFPAGGWQTKGNREGFRERKFGKWGHPVMGNMVYTTVAMRPSPFLFAASTQRLVWTGQPHIKLTRHDTKRYLGNLPTCPSRSVSASHTSYKTEDLAILINLDAAAPDEALPSARPSARANWALCYRAAQSLQ